MLLDNGRIGALVAAERFRIRRCKVGIASASEKFSAFGPNHASYSKTTTWSLGPTTSGAPGTAPLAQRRAWFPNMRPAKAASGAMRTSGIGILRRHQVPHLTLHRRNVAGRFCGHGNRMATGFAHRVRLKLSPLTFPADRSNHCRVCRSVILAKASAISGGVRRCLAMAVGAQHSKIIEPVVVVYAILVIDLDREGASPPLGEPTFLARIFQ